MNEGDHTGLITFSIASDDIAYSIVTIPDITVNILDNDNEVAIESADQNLLLIYPTINNGIFTVQAGLSEHIIYVINMQGQLVYQNTICEQITLDISSSPAGKYFVVMNDHNKLYTQAIEIIK